MVAPSYAIRRSEHAKGIGFGRIPKVSTPAALKRGRRKTAIA
jgi:predicted transcriptional regulator